MFANDRRDLWGFVFHGSVFLPSFKLQCSQNVETLWHGDNFLSNRQCCQQCRFVIFNCRIQPGAGFAGLQETITSSRLRGLCLSKNTPSLLVCLLLQQLQTSPYVLDDEEGFKQNREFWKQILRSEDKNNFSHFLIETSILKSWLDLRSSLFSCNQTRSRSPLITKFRLVCYVFFSHYFCCWLNSVAA